MPQTKLSNKNKTKTAKTPAIKNTKISYSQPCAACWLFKLMIGLFIAMIIFWIGFCVGTISLSFGSKYRALSTFKPGCVKNINPNDRMCLNIPTETLSTRITSSLANKKGDNFDKEFVLQLTLQQQTAIDLAKLALEKSSREEIRDLAQRLIESSNKEIELMKSWGEKWFKK